MDDFQKKRLYFSDMEKEGGVVEFQRIFENVHIEVMLQTIDKKGRPLRK